MKILVIAPSWIGDLVMSQTLLIKLKEMYPDCIIDVLCPQWCIQVINRMPQVNKSLLMPIGHGSFDLKGRYNLGKQLRSENYDTCYILPNSWKSALIPLFANIKNRIGWIGESRYFLLTSYRKNKKDFPKLIERYTSLALDKTITKGNDIGTITYPCLEASKELTDEIIEKYKLNKNHKSLGICPGAEFGKTKQWAPEYYAKYIELFLEKYPKGEIRIFGSNKDVEISNTIKSLVCDSKQSQIKILAGKTSLLDAIDIIANTNLVICNDSGLMHITAAVKTKLVAIFGSTSTLYTPPSTTNDMCLLIESDEPCHPCFKKTCKFNSLACLKKISPDYVWKQTLGKWNDV